MEYLANHGKGTTKFFQVKNNNDLLRHRLHVLIYSLAYEARY